MLDRRSGKIDVAVNDLHASFADGQVATIQIEPGKGINVVDVERLAAAHLVNVKAATGSLTTVRLSPTPGTLGVIAGIVTVDGFATTALEVHDEHSSADALYQVFSTGLVASTQPTSGTILTQGRSPSRSTAARRTTPTRSTAPGSSRM